MAKRVTSTMINNALKARGHSETLVRGCGYWYFTGGNSANWYGTSVYVSRITDYTLDQWLDEYAELSTQRR